MIIKERGNVPAFLFQKGSGRADPAGRLFVKVGNMVCSEVKCAEKCGLSAFPVKKCAFSVIKRAFSVYGNIQEPFRLSADRSGTP